MTESTSGSQFLPAKKLRLRRGDDGVLLLNLDGQNVALAQPKRALPLTEPDRFIVLSDSDGNELGIVRDVAELETDSRAVLQEALERTYVIERITRILEVEKEPLTGQTRWRVEIAADDLSAELSGTYPELRKKPPAVDGLEALDTQDGVGRDGSADGGSEKLLGKMSELLRRAKDKEDSDIATQEREFLINGQEDVQTARYPHIYLVDTERNRYEILDCEALDLDSRRAAERFF